MDQMKRLLKQLTDSNEIPYEYTHESNLTPMSILLGWAKNTDMKQISIPMLKDWFEELEELENEMIAFYKAQKHGKKEGE